MDSKTIKEYVRLNRRWLNPGKSDCAGQQLQKFNENFAKMHNMDKPAEEAEQKLRNHWMELFFHFACGLTYWVIICLAMLAYPLLCYFSDGEIITLTGTVSWAMFLLPGFLLGLRIWFISIESVRTAMLTGLPHIAWFVICFVCGGIRHMKIFGSNMNWLWLYCVVGTVITLAVRLAEHVFRILPNENWYKNHCSKLRQWNRILTEAAEQYSGFGKDAAQQLQKKFPQYKLQPREPWFAFTRKYEKDGAMIIPRLPKGNTDFRTEIRDSKKEVETEDYDSYETTNVTDQFLGFEHISRQEAKDLVGRGTVYPFFSMGLPEFPEDAVYDRLVHRWRLEIRKTVLNHRTTVGYQESLSHKTFDASAKADEMRYFGGGRTAEDVARGMGTGDEMVEAQRYLKMKEEARSRIPMQKVTHVNDSAWNNTRTESYDELAFIRVCAPDGEVLGIYCGENRGAIEAAKQYAERTAGFVLTPRTVPSSPCQKAYMYQFVL